MALRDQPYIPLYVQDYLTDEKLNMCSLKAQGAYIKIMCILHKSDGYGKLLLKQKEKQHESMCLNFAYKLAKLLPVSVDDLNETIKELVEEHVLTISDNVLYQKRMVRDSELSLKRSMAGSKGGKSSQSKNKKEGFAKAKDKANSEYEYEIEDENEIDSLKESEKTLHEPMMRRTPHSYSEAFTEKWEEWKRYCMKEYRQSYPEVSEIAALREIKSNARDEEEAINMIDHALSRKWKHVNPLSYIENVRSKEIKKSGSENRLDRMEKNVKSSAAYIIEKRKQNAGN